MSETKKAERFQILDNFISTTKPSNKNPIYCTSCSDLRRAQNLFVQMENCAAPYYEIFGGCGYDSFGLYKSSENIIYFIIVNFQTIKEYMVINSVSQLTY